MIDPRPVVELLWSWPNVCKAAQSDWAKSFAYSIAKQAKRPGWQPSRKQHLLMNKLVADLYRHGADEADVIENDDG